MHCQNNIAHAFLEQKSLFTSKEHNITTLINKWDGRNLSPTQLYLIGCILLKKESIRAGPNRRRFLQQPSEHVKSTHPYSDPDFIKSKKLPQK